MSPIQVGERVGNYMVRSLLGAGAMGSVYLAEHPQIGRFVAIKVLGEHLAHLRGFPQRFMSEAKAISRIKHPNVIDIYDFGQTQGGQLYYLMDYLEGCELSEVMTHHGPMALDEATFYVQQMCAGLQAAHDAGVIHRDLKPANIFVLPASPPKVKLLDFGIAKLVDQPAKVTATATGVVMGSPFTIAPEQAKGQVDRISTATDIYSLGATVFWMLTGQPPFRGEAPAVILARHITEAAPPLASLVPSLPAGVTEVVDRCLAKEPEKRPATATEIAQVFVDANRAALAHPRANCTGPAKRLTDELAELFARRTPPPSPAVGWSAQPARMEAPNTTTLRGSTGELVPIYTEDDEHEDRIPRSRILPWVAIAATVATVGTGVWYLSVGTSSQPAVRPPAETRPVATVRPPPRPSSHSAADVSDRAKPEAVAGMPLGMKSGSRLHGEQQSAREGKRARARSKRKKARSAPRVERRAAKWRGKYTKAFFGALKARAVGDTGRAIALALDATQIDPSRPEPFRLLGALYRDQGQHKYSASYYREYLALRPDAPDAAYILQLLGK